MFLKTLMQNISSSRNLYFMFVKKEYIFTEILKLIYKYQECRYKMLIIGKTSYTKLITARKYKLGNLCASRADLL